jgi:hypothetical protein
MLEFAREFFEWAQTGEALFVAGSLVFALVAIYYPVGAEDTNRELGQ